MKIFLANVENIKNIEESRTENKKCYFFNGIEARRISTTMLIISGGYIVYL